MVSRIKVQVGADIDSIRLIIPSDPPGSGSEAVKEYEYQAPIGIQKFFSGLTNYAEQGRWQTGAAEKVRVPFTRVPLPEQAVGLVMLAAET